MVRGSSSAIIFGDYVNAFSIIRSLLRIKWSGRIISLKDGKHTDFIRYYKNKIEIFDVSYMDIESILKFLQSTIPNNEDKVLFFTNEKYHECVNKHKNHPWFKSSRYFLGSNKRLDVILDRFKLYEFVNDKNLCGAPKTVCGTGNPFVNLGDKFIMRARKSWNNGLKTPRVKIIEDKDSFESAISEFRRNGLEEKDWCFQEILSLRPEDNVSVSGWHDESASIMLVTRKLMQHPKWGGNGDIVEVVEPHTELLDVAKRILSELDFTGPFEMEFIRDQRNGEFKLIELNPRFWMQHEIIGQLSNDGLVRKYLNLDWKPNKEGYERKSERRYSFWLYTPYVFYRLVRMDLRVVPYLISSRSLLVPDFFTALKWTSRYSWRLLQERLT